MPTIFQIAAVIRTLIGVPRDCIVAPRVLAVGLTLDPIGTSEPRVGLIGLLLFYDERLPPELQDYQVARAACAFALRGLGLLRQVSPHDLAVELCGVGRSVQLPLVGEL